MKDCSEKPDPCGNARRKVGQAQNCIFIQNVLGFGRFTEINKNKILFQKNISIFALYTTKIFKSSLNDK
ncbi:MAG: hypothetical protein A3F91_11950 [Flavobacteria bacterium RIFCSPLOWO2_12_FULL_35_11]|nr:MAG: hypothetical protein A3F91_11950 [Flavobacteria bacterium RIFCSPLOWO2_12_FULL_35_11]